MKSGGGIPAKKMGQRFSDDIIMELQNIHWWDMEDCELKKHMDLFCQPLTLERLKMVKNILKRGGA